MSPSTDDAADPGVGAMGGSVVAVPDVVPACPQGLTITRHDFVRPDFTVDGFLTSWNSASSVVSSSGRPRTLETLRDDLGVYLKVLRSAMIELINEDYADFVNLSTNLVGLDQSISQLEAPLVAFRSHVEEVRAAVEASHAAVNEKLRRRDEIHKKKVALQNLEHITNTVAKIERLLGLGAAGKVRVEDLSGDLIERVATEINHLNFCVSKCESDTFVAELNPRLGAIGDCVHGTLEAQMLEAAEAVSSGAGSESERARPEGVLKRCLRIYATIDRIGDAERLVRERLVRPYMEEVLTEQSLNDDPKGLAGVYKRTMKVIPDKLSVLLNLTHKVHDKTSSLQQQHKDYDFLVTAVWPEIVEQIDENLGFIFSAGNPEKFFDNYTTTTDFVAQFEKALVEHGSSVAHFRESECHKNFLGRWNLPIYFQIRFQEIALPVETALADIFLPSKDKTSFELRTTEVVEEALMKCFAADTFLDVLAPEFFKLSLQIVSRFATGAARAPEMTVKPFEGPEEKMRPSQTVASGLKDLESKGHARTASDQGVGAKVAVPLTEETYKTRPSDLIRLWIDLEDLASRLETDLCDNVILKAFPRLSTERADLLRGAVVEGSARLRGQQAPLTALIVEHISGKCKAQLKQVSDIPRLYRRTNKELPTKPCAYMTAVLSPLDAFFQEHRPLLDGGLGADGLRDWLAKIFGAVAGTYLENVSEVLAAVQKMEESLKRLKRVRDTRKVGGGGEGAADAAAGAEGGGRAAISDDDKIRLQLYLDVSFFLGRMERVYGVKEAEVEKAGELRRVVDEATRSYVDIRVDIVPSE